MSRLPLRLFVVLLYVAVAKLELIQAAGARAGAFRKERPIQRVQVAAATNRQKAVRDSDLIDCQQ